MDSTMGQQWPGVSGTTRSTLTVAQRVEAEDLILSYLIPKSEPHDTI